MALQGLLQPIDHACSSERLADIVRIEVDQERYQKKNELFHVVTPLHSMAEQIKNSFKPCSMASVITTFTVVGLLPTAFDALTEQEYSVSLSSPVIVTEVSDVSTEVSPHVTV